MKKNLVIIAAGGTGGHVFPAVSVAKKLMEKGYDVLFSTDERGKKYLKEFANKSIVYKINTKSRIKLYTSIIFSIIKSFIFLAFNRPSCIIGFGGYPSVPFVFSGQALFVKTIIHEQNAVFGKANAMLSKFADKILLSFDTPHKNNKYEYTGNPTRFDDIYEKVVYSPCKKKTIFVMGGSQGASVMSGIVKDAILSLNKEITDNLFVYQQTRKEDLEKVASDYKKSKINCQVADFFNNVDEIYTLSDLVISRSGASSIFEIIGFKRPSVLIPYKKSINGDQEANAKFMEEKKASIVLDENNLDFEKFREILSNILINEEKLIEMSCNTSGISIKNASSNIANIVENFILRK